MCKKIKRYNLFKKGYKIPKLLLFAVLLTAFRNNIDLSLPFEPITQTPQRVALLLPLKGEWKAISEAIQNGFLEANLALQNPLAIKTINTYQDKTLQKSYQLATQWGSDLMVGPLLKTDVKILSKLRNLNLPVLTLNYLTQQEDAPANFYQFGLSPLDEAVAITQHAKAEQHQSALILVPDNEWGTSLAESFIQNWEHAGGKVAGILKYSDKMAVLNHQIRKFLGFIPPKQRRDDFDVVFLGANSKMGRQINPLFAFYFAANVPLYATAAIYDAKIPLHLTRDLDNIMIADAPWSIGVTTIYNNIRKRCITQSPKSFEHYARYYALGVDAFHLTMELAALDQNEQKIIQGASGELSINADRYVVRKPFVAQIKRGILKPLSL